MTIFLIQRTQKNGDIEYAGCTGYAPRDTTVHRNLACEFSTKEKAERFAQVEDYRPSLGFSIVEE